MRRFGGERLKGWMSKAGLDDMPIEHSLINKTIEQAQTRVEGYNFDIRKRVLEYDEVVNKQRQVIYEQRRRILQVDDLREILLEMANSEIARLASAHTQNFEEDWDLDGLQQAMRAIFPLGPDSGPSAWIKMTPDEIVTQLQERAAEVYDQNRERIGKEVMRQLQKETRRLDQLANAESPPGIFSLIYRELKKRVPTAVWTQLEIGLIANMDRPSRDLVQVAIGDLMTHRQDRWILVRTVDTLWIRHLTDLDILREGIGLRAYAQQDPLVAFKKDGHEMYGDLLAQIQQEVVQQAFRPTSSGIVQRAIPQPKRQLMTNRGAETSMSQRTVRKAKQTVGRNDLCPCGSGKKYKNCCMRKSPAEGQVPKAASADRPDASGRKPRKKRRKR